MKTGISEETQIKNKNAMKVAQELIDKFKLDMKLVNAEYLPDGSKVIIYFVSETRVDFRELVKELAGRLKIRIELRQIGTREQAKMVGGIGICGQECCCTRFLNDFEKVSLKMAKNQGLSLNPAKMSGLCGRLLCCLEYENPYYRETLAKMPRINDEVTTPGGKGVVQYLNVLKQTVTVKTETSEDNYEFKDYDLKDVKFVRHGHREEEEE